MAWIRPVDRIRVHAMNPPVFIWRAMKVSLEGGLHSRRCGLRRLPLAFHRQ
jgi:hypothetical protein